MIRWKPSREQFVDSHCGQWRIAPKYWGRVRAVEYELRRGAGYGVHVGNFDTQAKAKAHAASLPNNPGQTDAESGNRKIQ